MPDSRGPSEERAEQLPRAQSRIWLYAAAVVTLVCGVLVFYSLAGLVKMPTAASEGAPLDSAQDRVSLDVAVARAAGGPGEWTNWARVIKYLSEELETPLNVRYLSKEDEAADIIVATDVDIAFICAHHYLDLTESGEVDPVCVPIIDGSSTTRMQLIVRTDDPAESMSDIVDSVVAASDKSSLGGYAYLTYLCSERDLVPSQFFSEVRLGDSQEANISDLRSGDIRATVVNSAQVVSWDMSEFKVIEQSPPFGSTPIVVNSDMSPELRERIATILLEMDVGSQLSADSVIDGFARVDDDDYAFAKVLRDACGHHDHNK